MGNHIRPATEADLPALKDIVLSGLVNDSIWHYCFPDPTSSEAGDYVESILKKSVWQELHENDSEDNNVHNQIHRVLDAPSTASNKVAKRIAALQAVVTQTQQTYLARYGQLMFVHAVITHPHYKLRGFAKLLCKQSLQVARQKGLVATALASPFSGYAEGELDKIELQIMVCAPPRMSDSRRGSFMGFLGSRASTPDRRESHDQGATEHRRSSFLDVFSFGGRRPSSDHHVETVDERRSSHHI
ncbi:hypothetical protein CEP52_006517 [Fusarium oligoseptatum]|uniref:N-acetyltransferase domain-containing protein n=1 Tax=Fusarium oligoseptatum TaxID=2604345 RepID=A0A428TSJ2_9HYPO|nr:hypothetical protein CEP52_006517 [Fusarium oligoseptatum]